MKQSDAVDQAIALEAIAKRKRGEIPSDREHQAPISVLVYFGLTINPLKCGENDL